MEKEGKLVGAEHWTPHSWLGCSRLGTGRLEVVVARREGSEPADEGRGCHNGGRGDFGGEEVFVEVMLLAMSTLPSFGGSILVEHLRDFELLKSVEPFRLALN